MPNRQDMTDHDLLIRIDERMENAIVHLQSINGWIDNHGRRISTLESSAGVLRDRWNWLKWAIALAVTGGLTGLATLATIIWG